MTSSGTISFLRTLTMKLATVLHYSS